MNKRVGGSGFVTLGLVLSLVGIFGAVGDWWDVSSSDGRVTLGLRTITACTGFGCRSESLRMIPGIDPTFSISGNVAYFSTLIAAALAVMSTGLALANKSSGTISPARLAAAFYVIALAAGLVFTFLKPSELQTQLGPGALLSFAGMSLGVIGNVLLAVVAPTSQAETSKTIPACPKCNAPMTWMDKHERWYCDSCRIYGA